MIAWKTYRRRAMGILALSLGCCFMLYALQRRLLYFPQRESFETLAITASQHGLQPWKTPAAAYIGWESQVPQARRTWLVFHGNAGCAVNRSYYVQLLRAAAPDSNILLFEYPGYGAREGAPSEKNFLVAAQAAIDTLDEQAPLFVVGESLGSGVACQIAAANPQRIQGLLLVTPFNNLEAMAAHHFPFLPVRWLLMDRFASDRALENYSGPIAIGIAGRDEVVPPQLGRQLFAGYHGPKQLWEVPYARHNTVLDDEQWWQEAVRFLIAED